MSEETFVDPVTGAPVPFFRVGQVPCIPASEFLATKAALAEAPAPEPVQEPEPETEPVITAPVADESRTLRKAKKTRNKAGTGVFHKDDIVVHLVDGEPPLRGEVIDLTETELRIFDLVSEVGSRNLLWVERGSCVRVEGQSL